MDCTLQIRAVPGAGRDACAGLMEDGVTWKVRLAAPAVDGKANAALIAWLAKTLGVSRSAVCLLRGDTARSKILSIAGISPEAAAEKMQQCSKKN